MIRFAALFAILCASPWLGRSRAQSALSEAKGVVQQWVETRQLISQTRTEWAEEKDSLEQTRALFQGELDRVRQSLSQISTHSTQVEKEQAGAEAKRQELESALQKAAEIVSTMETEARKLIPLVPPPLMETVRPLVDRLPADPAKTKASLPERVQAVVALLNEIDKFNNSITVVNERRGDGAGAQVDVDAVYLGLGTAYFVEPAGRLAGVGSPGAQGWQWSNHPELAPAVREMVAMYRNQKPAAFAPVPATVQ